MRGLLLGFVILIFFSGCQSQEDKQFQEIAESLYERFYSACGSDSFGSPHLSRKANKMIEFEDDVKSTKYASILNKAKANVEQGFMGTTFECADKEFVPQDIERRKMLEEQKKFMGEIEELRKIARIGDQ